jgi:hypothetical protein
MVTAYSPILKLALPVQGELSGTWGDVVNDNITSMVEQAIAGRAVIDTWTTNSHVLTTANGTTSESRCAMLEFTDTGTALSGAGTVTCPTLSKIYIAKNASGQNVTLKTSGGTGILVPNGRTMFLFCDGTNVVEAVTSTTSLQLGTSTIVTAVLDEDNMASDSATSLATQQSIKAYVDSQVGANNELSEVLANGNTSGANDIIMTSGQKITTNTIDETTAASGVTIDSVLLKDDGVNATNLEITNIKANDGTAAGSIADSTGVVTILSSILTTADINGGTADGVIIGGTTPAAATVTNLIANTDLIIAGTTTITAVLDEDNMASDSATALATQQSIKAYVDSQVGTVDTLAEILAIGNTTGATDIAVDSAQKVQFRDAAIYINSSVDGQLDIVADTEIQIAATTIDVNGALDVSGTALVTGVLTTTAATVSNGGGQFNGAINVGVDDTGYDVKFFGATTGKSLLWDESADSLIVTGTTTLVGTTNLDAVDIDGATQIDATVTVGVDDTGYDVKFFGATAGAYMLWDESADDLILGGAAGLSVNSAATVGGTLGVTGVVTANAGVVVDNFTLDGTTLALSSGNMSLTAANIILDSSGDIVLDGDGADVLFKDGGTEYLRITNSSSDVIYKNMTGDKDLIFKGIDGGVEITALTLDMSAAGAATFNTSVLLSGTGGLTTTGGNNLTVSGSVLNHAGLIFATQAILPAQEGAEAAANVIDIGANGNEFKSLYLNTSIINDAGFTLDSGGDIILDADGGDIFLDDGGTRFGKFSNDSSSLQIKSEVSDKDIIFKGNDGGSSITALTLDMSEAGAATFNNKVTAIQYNISSVGNDDRQVGVDGQGFFVYNTADSRYDLQINDVGAVSIGGVVTANAGVVVDNFTLDGTTLALSSGSMTLDSASQIVLDAAGGNFQFSKSGTEFGRIFESGSDFYIYNPIDDKDIKFYGLDGGVSFTALTLDMSAAGAATFNAGAVFNGAATTIGAGLAATNVEFNLNGYVSKAKRIQFQESGVNRWLLGQGAATETSAFELYNTDGTVVLSVNKTTNAATFSNDVTINGALSKSSGSFKIDHPLPAKTETHNLVHSFIEGPQADNIYRGKVALVDGSATVNIDDVAGMTDGTFAVLNREVQCFTSNETGWTAVRGSVSGNILTIEAQDASCTDTISWMVIGERQDKHMYDTEWTDENGKVIVEPLKEK